MKLKQMHLCKFDNMCHSQRSFFGISEDIHTENLLITHTRAEEPTQAGMSRTLRNTNLHPNFTYLQKTPRQSEVASASKSFCNKLWWGCPRASNARCSYRVGQWVSQNPDNSKASAARNNSAIGFSHRFMLACVFHHACMHTFLLSFIFAKITESASQSE